MPSDLIDGNLLAMADASKQRSSKPLESFGGTRLKKCHWKDISEYGVMSPFLSPNVQGAATPSPPSHCGRNTILVETFDQCSEPDKVWTTPQFGTPNGVLHCSMSPQGIFYAHIMRVKSKYFGSAKRTW